jgi:hypothetical protein
MALSRWHRPLLLISFDTIPFSKTNIRDNERTRRKTSL